MSRPPPACIAKLGIREIRDNLGEDLAPDWTRDFMRIFKPELEQRFHSQSGGVACEKLAQGSAPSICK